MRFAFAIMAHRDPSLLNKLIKQILSDASNYVYIHLDSKSLIKTGEILSNERVTLIDERISVQWGDYSQIEAANLIFRSILASNINYDYIHFISGQDLLIKPTMELVKFLESNNRIELYMEITKLPYEKWDGKGGFDRILFHYPSIFMKRYKVYNPLKIIRKMYWLLIKYNLIPKKVLPVGIEFWGGSVWFTVSGSLLKESLSYIDNNPWYDEFFKNTYLSDEIYYSTLFMQIANHNDVIICNNLRYIDWNKHEKDESLPRTFTLKDRVTIEKSDKFFARKFNSDKDTEIIDYFCDKVNSANQQYTN